MEAEEEERRLYLPYISPISPLHLPYISQVEAEEEERRARAQGEGGGWAGAWRESDLGGSAYPCVRQTTEEVRARVRVRVRVRV